MVLLLNYTESLYSVLRGWLCEWDGFLYNYRKALWTLYEINNHPPDNLPNRYNMYRKPSQHDKENAARTFQRFPKYREGIAGRWF